ncbi:response regulator [Persicitalea jodogahamensis]|uniref:Response regulator n=1 Tax=Persicitalea jodogahamensis TaxID=402147 RepID=A0A8J3G8H7_9BACT|nr:response regulator [Persicitalea jodogahamensis]GHB55810.1 response regulator [Persicitalea jodogahamensis]
MSLVKTVFLVDDDQDDRFFLRQAIEEAGASIDIVEAENGLELLSLIQQDKLTSITLILLDMNMPKMNGLETIAAIRSDPKISSVPVVMISTSSNPNLIESAYRAGVNNFITKPSSFEGFTDLSHQLINSFLS